MRTPPFPGRIGPTVAESTPWWPPRADAGPRRPNVLVVLFDDVGFADLGCYGSAIATPTIDALAARGVRLTGFHTTAMCSTTRAALLTHLATSDAVSLHCPLTPATRGLLDAEALAALPPHALVVNLARGPVIDRAALDAALARGHLGGVGLDVFWDEPWDPADPLFADPRVATLPHVAGTTTEAFGRVAELVVENVARLQRGASLLHRIG